MQTWRIQGERVRLGVTALGGQLDNVCFEIGRGTIRPLHTAPWPPDGHADDVPPMLRVLRGDFFCAPFGASDVLPDEDRPHGTPANDIWDPIRVDDAALELELRRPVAGARLRKRVHVRPGEAAVYQEHVFTGGAGALPIGHHAMLRAAEPLRLGFSRWMWGGTPPEPLEPDPQRGTSRLAYPQTFADLAQVRLAAGDTIDLRTFPALERHEDLLMLVRAAQPALAWTAATAPRAGWVWFALRQPRDLRSTVLWMSHGGRRYPPFSGRHTHVIGLEEVTAFFHLGHRASIGPNALTALGYPTAATLRPEAPLCVRYVFGLAATPPGFDAVTALEASAGGVTLADAAGRTAFAPVDTDFVLAEH